MNKEFNIEKGRIFNHRDGMSELKIFEEQLKEKDMNDKEQGYTNIGTDGIMPISIESKEPTIAKETKEAIEKLTGVPEDLIKARKEVLDELAAYDQEINIDAPPKKKRGRPSKKHVIKEEIKPLKEWYCSTCREVVNEKSIMKIGAGDGGRYAAFCGQCQRSLGFIHPDLDAKIAALIKNNPTGK